jgi:hypothetical protein
MRKVTEKTVRAFLNGRSITIGNTTTDGQSLYLHGNRIAMRDGVTGEIWLSTCGWNTITTRERLNGILKMSNNFQRVFQEKGKLYIRVIGGGEGKWEWKGNWKVFSL